MINIVDRIYKAMADPMCLDVRSKNALYPSSASVRNDGKTIGACLRSEYYSWFNAETVKDRNPEYELAAIAGHYFHDMVLDLITRTSPDTDIVVLSNEQRIYDPKYILSGRSDLFLRDLTTDSLFGVDVKSLSDYMCTTSWEWPREKDILQCAIYLDQYDRIATAGGYKGVKEWIILYVARAENYRIKKYAHGSPFKIMWQFSMFIEKDGSIRVENQNGQSRHYPDININGIYARYEELLGCIQDRELPDRDYVYQYTEEQLVGFSKLGTKGPLNKADREQVDAWVANGAPPGQLGLSKGDWECRNCRYVNVCYSENPEKFETEQPVLHKYTDSKDIIVPSKPTEIF